MAVPRSALDLRESGHPAAYMRPLDQTTALNYVVGWSQTLGERLVIPLVQLLVQLGASVDRDDGGVYEKYTPLHAAVTIGSSALVGLLLALGADPNARTSEGQCHACCFCMPLQMGVCVGGVRSHQRMSRRRREMR